LGLRILFQELGEREREEQRSLKNQKTTKSNAQINKSQTKPNPYNKTQNNNNPYNQNHKMPQQQTLIPKFSKFA
jgi:hypothetical protein